LSAPDDVAAAGQVYDAAPEPDAADVAAADGAAVAAVEGSPLLELLALPPPQPALRKADTTKGKMSRCMPELSRSKLERT
jgi:hypothetical protein